jgi:hypothetical protein
MVTTDGIDALLAAAQRQGLRVTAQSGRLVVRGPADADQGLVRGLLGRKGAVLWALLRPSPDEWAAWQERAAIGEIDGRLSRAEAETLAWAELQVGRGENPDTPNATSAVLPSI